MQKCDQCDLHDIRGAAVCKGRKCPVKFKEKKGTDKMDKWTFQKISDNNAVAGVITATGPEATDYDMTEQFQDLEFGPEDNGKIIIIDREKIESDCRFATVMIAEEAPVWATLALATNDQATIQKIESIINETRKGTDMADTKKFTWNGKEDPEVVEKGVTLMWATGTSKRIQAFVEALSNKVGAKADWAYQGGRAHIEIMPEGVDEAMKLIADAEYMKQFYAPYEENKGNYFERLR